MRNNSPESLRTRWSYGKRTFLSPETNDRNRTARAPERGQFGCDRSFQERGKFVYHMTIEFLKIPASCSASAGRGESLVTRCCGNVPSTSAGMSAGK